MSEIPQIPPIPPGFKSPPNFNSRPLSRVLCQQIRQQVNKSEATAALELSDWTVSFLTAFQPPPGSDYIAALDAPPRIQVFTWINRTKQLRDYLDAYLTEVRRDGTPEQIKFLGELLDRPKHEDDAPKRSVSDDADDDSADVAEVVSFPEPSEAITILDRIAQGYASTSVEYVALQITVRAIRHLIESGEAPEFMRYVDQMSKWDPPSVE